MKFPILLKLVAVLGVVTVVTACGQSAHRTSQQSDFDQQFIDMMVPHHQGAVEMAVVAGQRGQRPEIRQMSEAILTSQAEEIRMMQNWRSEWFGSSQTPPMERMPMIAGDGGHGADTMDMAADVAALRAAGEPFDHALIDAMIPHHQSAIEAGKAAETRARRPEVKLLAAAIVADQQREIAQMEAWREAWFSVHPH